MRGPIRIHVWSRTKVGRLIGSEDGDRVEERPRAAGNRSGQATTMNSQRRLLLADLDQLLELETVGADMPMATIWRTWIGYAIPSMWEGTVSPSPSGRKADTLRSWSVEQSRDVKAGFSFAVVTVVPGPQLQAPPVMAGAEQQDVTLPAA